MKKIFSLYIFLLVLATGCLEVDMVDRFETESYYKNEQQALEAIYGVYSTLTESQYHKTSWGQIMPGYSDCMFVTGTGVPGTVSNNKHSSSSAPNVNFWGTIYTGINRANEVIAKVPNISFTNENDKNRILAEAYFLRALFHYDLVRMFGGENGIPVITNPVTGLENAYHEQVSKDKVYEQIIKDLEYAAGNNDDGTTKLPKITDSGYISGRATNGAAHGFLAEVNLTLGQWQNAIDEADIVIGQGYSFVDDYAKLWDINNEANAQMENIFYIPFFGDKDAPSGDALGGSMAYLFNPAGVFVGGGAICGNPYGKGVGNQRVQKWFIRFYQDDVDNLGYSDPTVDASIDEDNLIYKDYRIETSFWRTFQETNSSTGELKNIVTCYPAAGGKKQQAWGYVKKFIDPNGISNNVNGNDLPRLRLSDMYLIKAEAYNELDDMPEACKAINKVRERARRANGIMRDYPKDVDKLGRTLTKQEFRWLVFMERGLEFIGEGKRWFDLIRMKYNDNTLMYDYMKDSYLPSWTPAADINKQGVMSDRKKCFPIPQNEILRNKGVIQNTGY